MLSMPPARLAVLFVHGERKMYPKMNLKKIVVACYFLFLQALPTPVYARRSCCVHEQTVTCANLQ